MNVIENLQKDGQRHWNVGAKLGNNARRQDLIKLLSKKLNESLDNYATLKCPLSESKIDGIYVYDVDY